MNRFIDGKTTVYFCEECGHLQTNELPHLADFYAHEYEINLSSEEDDQLYRIVDGKPEYRADFQAEVLMSKVDFRPGCRVLDYGCAKAPTLRKILATHAHIRPFLFDVTDKYIPFWERFPVLPRWSVGEPDGSWRKSMDVVLSFYALEHVAALRTALDNVKALLKPGGVFYFIVPNVYSNIADFIVADHVNHFSEASLKHLLIHAGFCDPDVDSMVHDAAFVVKAQLPATLREVFTTDHNDLSEQRASALKMAHYWSEIVRRIREFEREVADGCAIYGAGFYGNFIATSLVAPERIRCFVDQNRFLQGTQLHGRPVLAPQGLPLDVKYVLVGLNPRNSRSSIEAISSWRDRNLTYFFL
jgi:SAM-dependent methyltransferase